MARCLALVKRAQQQLIDFAAPLVCMRCTVAVTKHIPFSRMQFRKRLRAYLQANWRLFLLVLSCFIAVAVLTCFLLDGYLLGVVHSTLLLSYVGMVTLSFLALNTGAIGQLSGAWGEEQTMDVLKKARRRGLIWSWVDGIATSSGDIDHFVITKAGGLVAIDSKWRNDVSSDRVAADAQFAQAAARRANNVLRSLKVPVGVTPLIVIWGGARNEVPQGANVEGVDFIDGDHLLTWLSELSHETVDEISARDLEKRLKGFRSRVRPTAKAQ